MRKCHFCHGDIGDAAIVCQHCRKDTIAGRTRAPLVAPSTKTCPFCAEEIQTAASVCKHCGRDLAPVVAREVKSSHAGRNVLVVLGVACLVVLFIAIMSQSSPEPTAPSQAAAPGAFDTKDWHRASATMEVKWINDDVFSHVGGHCYGRKIDGSIRTPSGEPGLAQIGEKFCIAAGAKDTPFDVPDKR
jgi:hypothetical protein